MMIPNILSIAGSDPSGGAGIQADIKAISASGGYAMAVIAALTAQNTVGVQAVQLLDCDFIVRQIESIRADIHVHAIKIGMLGSAECVDAIVGALAGIQVPVVVDPVMVAKSGDRLLREDAVTALRDRLLPHAQVVTPNLPEAADLLGVPEAKTRAQMIQQARDILRLGPSAVVLKGGHLEADSSPDLLVTAHTETWFAGERIPTRNTHGTGCTFSSALATRLGQDQSLDDAVMNSKAYVTRAIAAADRLQVGHGHGPLNHFAAMVEQ